MKYQGRLGNLLYMYAFHYVYSIQKNVAMVRTGNFDLDRVFVLEEGKFLDESQYNNTFCRCMKFMHDRFDCGYDENITSISDGQSVSFIGYFQSWKYWIEHEHTIRKLFTFQPEVKNSAERQFRKVLESKGWSHETDVFVGIHIRRGDYAKQYLIDFGQKTAPLTYINKAVAIMNNIHKRFSVKYIVFSDNIKWCIRYVRIKQKDVFFVQDNTAAVDMAMMTLTNHSIITAGTFGWWAAFLTNGTTLYYRDIFTKNTLYAEQFPNQDTGDFFPPHWIGID
ncbi:hypothetical protein FSP39_014893 [Pinctada imbricata]|uniref:L-Fucosyltransferase n=1 Tax=Pinctada imbricata TaxID=66713 RepID=A0AA88YQZ1_PINIB|nr:hypothetical protein FSP39_014893 [Pinctada imbricata]